MALIRTETAGDEAAVEVAALPPTPEEIERSLAASPRFSVEVLVK